MVPSCTKSHGATSPIIAWPVKDPQAPSSTSASGEPLPTETMGDLGWQQPPSKRTRLAEPKPHPRVIRPKPTYAALPLVELAPPNYDALSRLQHRAHVEQQQQAWETQWHGSMLGMPPGTFLAT